MVTKEQLFEKWVGAPKMYSTVMLLAVDADSVVDALNDAGKMGWNTDGVTGGEEYKECGINVISFRIFKENPEIVFCLTEKLNCKGYADTSWEKYCTLCSYKGVESNDYAAEWNNENGTYEDMGDGYYDAFVKITDPTGVVFNTGAGAVDLETAEYYRDIVDFHQNRDTDTLRTSDRKPAEEGAYIVLITHNFSTDYQSYWCSGKMEAECTMNRELETEKSRFSLEKGGEPVVVNLSDAGKILVYRDRRYWGDYDRYRDYDHTRYMMIPAGPLTREPAKENGTADPGSAGGYRKVFAKVSVSGIYTEAVSAGVLEDPDSIAERIGKRLLNKPVDLNRMEDVELFLYSIEDEKGTEIWEGHEN